MVPKRLSIELRVCRGELTAAQPQVGQYEQIFCSSNVIPQPRLYRLTRGGFQILSE